MLSNLRVSANKLAKEFEIITGISCCVVDIDDAEKNKAFNDAGFCAICNRIRKEKLGEIDCRNMMSYSCMQSEQWGGKYESLCPISLAFISTVVYNDKEKFGLCMGPFLMMELDDFISEDIVSAFPPEVRGEIVEEVKKIPYIEISKVNAYSDMLYMASCYVTERNSLEMSVLEQIAGNNKQQFEYIIDAKENPLLEYPVQSERVLQNYIIQGDKNGAQTVLNKLISQIFLNAGGDIATIRVRVAELLVLMSRAAVDGGADIAQVFRLNQDYIDALYKKKNLNELNQWLSEVLIRYTNTVFDVSNVEHSDVIMSIVDYIRRNYMNKISLEEIAESVQFSVSYISRIFKNEMGCSITTFINKVRVDNAKLLLLNQNIPLVEVAYLCGFEDQTYFSKVFKKVTDVSPGRFRDKRGKLL